MALSSLTNQQLPPVINLRNMNAYVVSSLEGWGQRYGRAPAVGRQGAQVCEGAASLMQLLSAGLRLSTSICWVQAPGSASLLAGTSSFGMSGVNAHALLMAASDPTASEPSAFASSWVRERCWPTCTHHPMLLSAKADTLAVECYLDWSAPSMAWARDHHVWGRCLVPGAAMFEMAGAAAAACHSAGGDWRLQGIAILEPLVLPDVKAGSALSSMWVRCAVDIGRGSILLGAAGGRKHLSAAVSKAAGEPRQWEASHVPKSGLRALSFATAQPTSQPHSLASVGATKEQSAG